MKNKKTINIMVILIIILTIVVSLVGLITSSGAESYNFISVFGDKVKIYGIGIYKNNSISVVAQGLAQDLVSLVLGIPILIYALILFNKNQLKGKLLLSGLLGYFLYTYLSYTFLWFFNPLFLLYIAIMSLSLFAMILTIFTIDIEKLAQSFKSTLPIKRIGYFQIFTGLLVALMWLWQIIPASLNNQSPVILEHYTTLVIQALDLGIVVPIAIVSGVLLLKRKSMGYLLSSIVIIKTSALLMSITVMIFNQMLMDVNFNLGLALVFIVLNVLVLYPLYALLKNIKV